MPITRSSGLAIAALAAIVLLPNLGGPPLWDDDEPRNAACSLAMHASGDWIVPTFNGRLRVELEGRYRDPIEQTYIGFNREPPRDIPGPGPGPPKPDLIGTMEAKAYGGWSAMANVWRDFQFTDHLDLYGGGGIGAAGFNTSFQQIDTAEPAPIAYEYRTSYAWQLGLGGIWNINDRVAVDLSYRVFGVGWSVTADDLAYGFLRTEVLLSLRIYEPFRGLMR